MGLTTLIVVYRTVLVYSHPSPALLNRYLLTKWILGPHIVFASIALVTGPFQFSDRLRKRNVPLHRTLGKVYVLAIFAASRLPLPGVFFTTT
ncbi:DUF2306 domain-containing protein [Larkinella insperata]|uniref:DUF2306 domain-containing protein n=1 Tax=Larkinella insperata TaxID=332158 RepID=A0ABW3Q7F0_9BACT